ncbi:hypothetical protein [Sandaracinobacter sp.]|uniref:hypothetical protein n=1 Tax=Sandaracinobacter sp. TaxID=2487581 RepID=UPI0035AF57F9
MTERPVDLSLPPLIPAQWKAITGVDRFKLEQRYIDSLRPSFLRQFGPGEHERHGGVRAAPLACYPRHLLCEIGLRIRGEAMVGAFLFGAEGAIPIDGTSMPLHDLNERIGQAVDSADAAIAYTLVFGSAVHGGDGRFHVLGSADDLAPYNNCDTAPFQAIVQPPTARAEGEDWVVDAAARYGRTLFRTRFRIQRSGLIEMIDDEPLGVETACGPDRFQWLARGAPVCPPPAMPEGN